MKRQSTRGGRGGWALLFVGGLVLIVLLILFQEAKEDPAGHHGHITRPVPANHRAG